MFSKAHRNIIVPLAVLALFAAPSAFAEEQHVWIQKDGETIQCEGDDCKQMLFVGEEGEGHRILMGHGEGRSGLRIGSSHFSSDAGFLGVQLTDLTQELRDHFGIPRDAGVLIGQVVQESPAETAGLKVGDVIVSVDQEKVSNGGALAQLIGRTKADTVVTLEVWRDNGFSNFPVTLGKRERHVQKQKHIEIRCEGDDDPDCEHLAGFDCGSDECEVKVECSDSGCSCTVNGEAMECSDLPGFEERHGRQGE